MAIKQYPLKLDEELLEELKALADKNFRSLNKEIEYALTEYKIKNSNVANRINATDEEIEVATKLIQFMKKHNE